MGALLAAAMAADPPKIGPIEKEHKIVVDAVRNCPEHKDDEVVVCAKDRGFAEGYRIPKLDPRFANNLRPDGRGGLTDPSLGASGIGSCSNSGAGGSTGCSAREIGSWAAQMRQQQKDAHAYENPR